MCVCCARALLCVVNVRGLCNLARRGGRNDELRAGQGGCAGCCDGPCLRTKVRRLALCWGGERRKAGHIHATIVCARRGLLERCTFCFLRRLQILHAEKIIPAAAWLATSRRLLFALLRVCSSSLERTYSTVVPNNYKKIRSAVAAGDGWSTGYVKPTRKAGGAKGGSV